MLITQIKSKDDIIPAIGKGKIFLLSCLGCKQLHFPLPEITEFKTGLKKDYHIVEDVVSDCLCNPEYLTKRLEKYQNKIEECDTILVFACGVGVQTVAEYLNTKLVYAGCDTIFVPGFQGVTALEYNCVQCGECRLSDTGGICPITACSKSLLNGQCGGAKNGKCEVDKNMDCGWEKIHRRLEKLNKPINLKNRVDLRNFSK